MTFTYSSDENDYLQHTLYIASKSDRVKNERRKGRFLITILFLGLSFILFKAKDELGMYLFLSAAVLSFLLYPAYLKRYYLKHYRKNVADIYKNRFNKSTTITFKETTIDVTDITGEMKINFSIIQEIVETGNYFYLRINTGGSLIISKTKIENPGDLALFLKALAGKLNINYTEELNWEWK